MASAAIVAASGLVYLVVGLAGTLMRPPGLPALAPADPYLAILEGLIIVTALALVVMAAAVAAAAARDLRALALAALAFTSLFALATCATHFVSLTIGRETAGGRTPELARQLAFEWPSVSLAVDLLAWDLLLGLALLFMAPLFRGSGLARAVRAVARAAGLLCLLGTVGPLTGTMLLQLSGIFGYAILLPAACLMIAFHFARPADADAR